MSVSIPAWDYGSAEVSVDLYEWWAGPIGEANLANYVFLLEKKYLKKSHSQQCNEQDKPVRCKSRENLHGKMLSQSHAFGYHIYYTERSNVVTSFYIRNTQFYKHWIGCSFLDRKAVKMYLCLFPPPQIFWPALRNIFIPVFLNCWLAKHALENMIVSMTKNS